MSEFKQRLNVLFRLLRKQGYVARQNFSCCGGCAAGEIGALVKQRDARGGVYYHQQDAERLPHGHVYLGYGAVNDGDSRQVGIAIVVAASQVGLKAQWDGNESQRVRVEL
jgi:hypothetical protein